MLKSDINPPNEDSNMSTTRLFAIWESSIKPSTENHLSKYVIVVEPQGTNNREEI